MQMTNQLTFHNFTIKNVTLIKAKDDSLLVLVQAQHRSRH
jgi:hypothetical protein